MRNKKRVLSEMNEIGSDATPTVITVQKSTVPPYLHSSDFYISLQDDEDSIDVPAVCMKMDDSVKNNHDLHALLNTLRFWVANPITDSILTYALSQSFSSYESVLSAFYRDLPVLQHIQAVVEAKPSERMLAAIESEVVDIVKYVNKRGAPWPRNTCDTIVKLGNLDLLKLAHESSCAFSPNATIFAAARGHIDCIKYLHENGCVWSESTCSAATRGDHLECLKYAHENGFPWNADPYDRYSGSAIPESLGDGGWFNICTEAVGSASLQCLKYAHSQGVPLVPALFCEAENSRDIECFRYAFEQGCRIPPDALDAAVSFNNIPYLEFLMECGLPLHTDLCRTAVAHGHLNCLQWLHELGCPWDEGACELAVDDDQVAMVLYLLRHGCPPSANLFAFETESQVREVLECFVELQLPWEAVPACTGLVATSGFIDSVKYMVQHGCPWEDNTTSCAALTGRLDILTFAHEHGCPWAPDTCLAAAQGGHLDCLTYAHTHGCPIPVNTCAELLEQSIFDFECFKYAHQHGSVLQPGFVHLAADLGRQELVKYLRLYCE